MSPLRLLGRRGRLLELYRRMVLLRAFENASLRWARGADAASEIVVVGAAAALGRDDHVVTADRPHRLALARGIQLDAVVAGLLGDARARDDWRITGGGLRSAVDRATSLVQGARARGVLCLPGAEQVSAAAASRALGMAARRRLPVVFVLPRGACGKEIPCERVDGGDAAAVHEAAARLLAMARRGHGPAVLELTVDEAMSDSGAPDPLTTTALQLAELGAHLQHLLAIAHEAEETVNAVLEQLSADAASALIEAASPA